MRSWLCKVHITNAEWLLTVIMTRENCDKTESIPEYFVALGNSLPEFVPKIANQLICTALSLMKHALRLVIRITLNTMPLCYMNQALNFEPPSSK